MCIIIQRKYVHCSKTHSFIVVFRSLRLLVATKGHLEVSSVQFNSIDDIFYSRVNVMLRSTSTHWPGVHVSDGNNTWKDIWSSWFKWHVRGWNPLESLDLTNIYYVMLYFCVLCSMKYHFLEFISCKRV